MIESTTVFYRRKEGSFSLFIQSVQCLMYSNFSIIGNILIIYIIIYNFKLYIIIYINIFNYIYMCIHIHMNKFTFAIKEIIKINL